MMIITNSLKGQKIATLAQYAGICEVVQYRHVKQGKLVWSYLRRNPL